MLCGALAAACSRADLGSDIFQPGPVEAIDVVAAYPDHAAWGAYVAKNDPAADPAHQAGTGCDPVADAGAGGPGRCVHAGELRMARMSRRAACADLTITDDLGLWRWQCAEVGDAIELYSTGLALGRGLRDVVTATGFRENVLRVAHTPSGVAVAESPSSVWGWPNAVVALPANGTGATAVLELPSAIYVLASSAASNGYNLAADGISVVTLADAVLSFGDASVGNCATDGTLDVAGVRTLFCGGNRNFLWIETRTSASAAQAVASHVRITGTTFSRFNILVADTSSNALVRCGSCTNSRFSGLDLANAGTQALLVDAGGYNEVTSFRARNALSEAIRVENGSNWNVIDDVHIANSGSANIASLVVAGPAAGFNRLSRVRVVDSRGGGIVFQTGAHDNWLLDFSVHRQIEVSGNSCLAVGGPANKIVNGVLSNCSGWGLRVQAFSGETAFDTTVVGLLIASTNVIGAYLQEQASRSTIAHVTTALNAQEGLGVLAADDTLVANLLTVVNAEAGIVGSGGVPNGDLVNNRMLDTMSIDNDVASATPSQIVWFIEDGWGSGQRFDGRLWVSGAPDGTGLTCNINETTTGQGLVDRTCTTTGADGSSSYGAEPSTATLQTNVASSNVVLGPVTDDDVSNLDTGGVANAASIGGDAWAAFESPFRTWGGLPGAAWANGSGICSSGQCRIWDWRLRATDTIARGAFGAFVSGGFCPSSVAGDAFTEDRQQRAYEPTANTVERAGDGIGDDDGTCEPGELCFNRFLLHAIEVVLDDLGDDDGLCESGEACIFAPNVGAYQGEGDYSAQRCNFLHAAPNGVSDVIMYGYPRNGSG